MCINLKGVVIPAAPLHPASNAGVFRSQFLLLPICQIWYVQPGSLEDPTLLLHPLCPRQTQMGWSSVHTLTSQMQSAPLLAAGCYWSGVPWACCDCGCVWDFFLEAHLSLLLFLFSAGLVWGGSSLVVRYLRSSEQGRLCGFCCWQMLFALLPHEFSVLKTRHKES